MAIALGLWAFHSPALGQSNIISKTSPLWAELTGAFVQYQGYSFAFSPCSSNSIMMDASTGCVAYCASNAWVEIGCPVQNGKPGGLVSFDADGTGGADSNISWDATDMTVPGNVIVQGTLSLDSDSTVTAISCDWDGTYARPFADYDRDGTQDSGERYLDLAGDMVAATYDVGLDGTVDSCAYATSAGSAITSDRAVCLDANLDATCDAAVEPSGTAYTIPMYDTDGTGIVDSEMSGDGTLRWINAPGGSPFPNSEIVLSVSGVCTKTDSAGSCNALSRSSMINLTTDLNPKGTFGSQSNQIVYANSIQTDVSATALITMADPVNAATWMMIPSAQGGTYGIAVGALVGGLHLTTPSSDSAATVDSIYGDRYYLEMSGAINVPSTAATLVVDQPTVSATNLTTALLARGTIALDTNQDGTASILSEDTDGTVQLIQFDASSDGTPEMTLTGAGTLSIPVANATAPSLKLGGTAFSDTTSGDTIKVADAGDFQVATYNNYGGYPLRSTMKLEHDPGDGTGGTLHVPFKVVWHDQDFNGTSGGGTHTKTLSFNSDPASNIDILLPGVSGTLLVNGTSTVNGKFTFTPSATTAAIALSQSAPPSSPATGDMWADSTTNSPVYYGGVAERLSGSIYTLTSSDTDATTAETSIIDAGGVGTRTLPANFLTIGKTIRITAYGVFSTAAGSPPNMTLKFYYGSTAMLDSGATSITANVTNGAWELDAVCTTRTIGAGGTHFCQGHAHFHTTHTGEVSLDLETTAATTVSTTGTLALDLKSTWSSSGQSITTTNAIIEVLN